MERQNLVSGSQLIDFLDSRQTEALWQRQKDRQTGRQTTKDKQLRNRQTIEDIQICIGIYRPTNKQKERQTDRQGSEQTIKDRQTRSCSQTEMHAVD